MAIAANTKRRSTREVSGTGPSDFDRSFLPPGFGQEVSGIAHAFPTAIPTFLDEANCGGNGFPPG